MAGPPKYRSIQLARAVAALAVICVHLDSVTNDIEPTAPASVFTFGQAGVDLFFVISGFIISTVIARRQTWHGFIVRRALRIYPFYWAFTLAWVALAYLDGKGLPAAGYFFRSVLGLPIEATPVLGVGWSLEHEFIFYALVAVLIVVRREQHLLRVMAVVFGVSLAVNLFAPTSVANGQDAHLLSLYHFEFLTGVVLYQVRHRVAQWPWVPLVVVGAALFPVSAAVLHQFYGVHIPTQPHGALGAARVLLFGVASFCLLSGLIGLEHQRPRAMDALVARGLEAVGNASYALYLCHPIIFAISGVILGRMWPHGVPAWPAGLLALAASVLFSLLWFKYVESPLNQRHRERRDVLPAVDGPA